MSCLAFVLPVLTVAFRESLVLGTASVVPLKISVRNDGEPAYLCQMLTVLPGGVGVAQVPTGCTLELQLLKCLVGNNFMRGGEVGWCCGRADLASSRFFLVGDDVRT